MRTRTPLAVAAAWPIAALLAVVSLGGLLAPATYAREAPAWVEQAIGQDWFDLVIAAPCLVIAGVLARRSLRWRAVLAGAYGYVVYELLIYAFAVHMNALFLLYCATLAGASFALIALIGDLRAQAPRLELDRFGGRLAGGFLIVLGALFALLWLGEDVPALIRHQTPATLVETGLFTNPVHVIDLSFVLPAHVIVGVLAWRGRDRVLAPVVLAFGVLMAASIGAMMVVIRARGGVGATPVIAAMFVVSAASALVLARATLGRWRPSATSPASP
jgi:hypothetical protein